MPQVHFISRSQIDKDNPSVRGFYFGELTDEEYQSFIQENLRVPPGFYFTHLDANASLEDSIQLQWIAKQPQILRLNVFAGWYWSNVQEALQDIRDWNANYDNQHN